MVDLATGISSIAKPFVPGSIAFLVLGLVCGLALWCFLPRFRSRISAAPIVLMCCYLVLSLPSTANLLADSLYRHSSVTRPDDARGAQVVLVLQGDHEQLRVAETIRLYQLLHPAWVIVSANAAPIRNALLAAGLPKNQVIWEYQSQTTRQQALEMAGGLRSRHVGRVVLVASPIHMPRALAACERAGIDAIPSVSTRPHSGLPRGFRGLVRRFEALTLSRESLYEHLALRWYSWRGWA
jgi:uncharacterized SAM-binding protein YcdF (DUF218 family)